jgi:hypothetical protein
MLWEVGVFGLGIYLIFLFLFLKDAILLKKKENFFGAFALGWIGIIIINFINLVYKNTFRIHEINLIFFYFSGVVVSKASMHKNLIR